jgi:hypothetical protein
MQDKWDVIGNVLGNILGTLWTRWEFDENTKGNKIKSKKSTALPKREQN